MDIDYVYTKVRSAFGKQCHFADQGPTLISNIQSDPSLSESYLFKGSMTRAVQVGCVQSAHEINTEPKNLSQRGMNHLEGGWPKEINLADEEQVMRFQKRIQREDNYVEVMRRLIKSMERAILQNNAINIYGTYFEDDDETDYRAFSRKEIYSQTKNVYRIPDTGTSVRRISWAPAASTTHLAITLSECPSYIWNLERPIKPEMEFHAHAPLTTLEYHPREENRLASGLTTGEIALWDIRKGAEPVAVSAKETCHRGPVSDLYWIASKSGAKLFTGSFDCMVKWWDIRRFQKPIDEINVGNPVALLEYDFGMPTRYMVASEDGCVISGNRRGSTPQEKLPWRIQAHASSILSIQRNYAFPKLFLTVADKMTRLWSEDCRESAVMWTPKQKSDVNAGRWSPSRFSVFYTVTPTGFLNVWDVTLDLGKPIFSTQLATFPLITLRCHEDGEWLAVGGEKGSTFLIKLSEFLASSIPEDKAFLGAVIDREVGRERILEAKNREVKLKLRQQQREEDLRKTQMMEEAEMIEEMDEEEEEGDTDVAAAENSYLGGVEAFPY